VDLFEQLPQEKQSSKQTLVANIFNSLMIKFSKILGIRLPNKVIRRAVAWAFYPRHGMIEAQAPPISSGSAKGISDESQGQKMEFQPLA
jgi:hypothetical protein